MLMIRARRQGYTTPVWATYRQWQECGLQVAKGAGGTRTILYRPATNKDGTPILDDDGRQRVYIRSSCLFNIAQCTEEGRAAFIAASADPATPTDDLISPVARAEALIAASGALIIEGGASAHYDPKADLIRMPDRVRYDGRGAGDPTSAWYSTLLHEFVHWVGAADRLDRGDSCQTNPHSS